MKAFKICLIGDPAVGKTSLRDSYMGKGFKEDYLATLGTNLVAKEVTLGSDDTSSIKVIFGIWDLSGQPSFKSIRRAFYQGAHGALVFFDVTRDGTFDHLEDWITECRSNSGRENLPFVILGNKIDLISEEQQKKVHDRAMKTREAPSFRFMVSGKEKLPDVILTSAKTGHGVNEAFNIIGNYLFKIKEK